MTNLNGPYSSDISEDSVKQDSRKKFELHLVIVIDIQQCTILIKFLSI